MAAHKIKCFTPLCPGTVFTLNDGASRLAAYFGRGHYQCDRCGARWSIASVEYARKLAPGTGLNR